MRWVFEPGHTAAEFRVRHMMVTWIRGHFKNVQGSIEFDPADLARSSVEARIDATQLWTGEPDRDAHLKSGDFLDVSNHPMITFVGDRVRVTCASEFGVTGDLTIRGRTRPVTLDVRYLGRWETPWWVGKVDRGPVTRAGFVATARINRHDFGVSWNSELPGGGIVAGDDVEITIDVEAIAGGLPA